MMVYGGLTSKLYYGLKEGRIITLNDNDVRLTGRNFKENVKIVGAEMTQSGVDISFGKEYAGSNNLCGTYPDKAEINKTNMLYWRFVNMAGMREE